jgi:hypothetical protein
MNDLIPIMPQMMRAQRLLELTMMRSCAWMQAPLQRAPGK